MQKYNVFVLKVIIKVTIEASILTKAYRFCKERDSRKRAEESKLQRNSPGIFALLIPQRGRREGACDWDAILSF